MAYVYKNCHRGKLSKSKSGIFLLWQFVLENCHMIYIIVIPTKETKVLVNLSALPLFVQIFKYLVHKKISQDMFIDTISSVVNIVVPCSVPWSVIYHLLKVHMLYSKDLTLCMCHFSLTFLHCVFSNVSSNGVHERMHNYTGCICLPFLHCAFSNVSSNYLPQ